MRLHFFPYSCFLKNIAPKEQGEAENCFLTKKKKLTILFKKIVCINFDPKLHQTKSDTFSVQWGKMLQSRIILCTLFHNFTWNSFAFDWSLKFFQGIGSLKLFRKRWADCRIYFSHLTKGEKRIAFAGNENWLYLCRQSALC